MNLPDWLSLSATSGTGSGKITATADKCTARAARRTTEFSVKTDSGSSRRVRVIQNGIAEFVNISTGDINNLLPNISDTITIDGTSNSAILTIGVSGTLNLTTVSSIVIDSDGNNVPFISGTPIDGDPGASAAYIFRIVLGYTSNPDTSVKESSVTISTQSGDSKSIIVSQMANDAEEVIYPYFTDQNKRTVDSAGVDNVSPVIVVHNPDSVPWDIICVGDDLTAINVQKGTEENYYTPIGVRISQNENVDTGKLFRLYLVPEGATTTSVVFSLIEISQGAARVNPYIIGDEPVTSYAGGVVTFNVVDERLVGWYPEVVYTSGSGGEPLNNVIKITGTGDVTGIYANEPIENVFAGETRNTKLVGSGLVRIEINNAAQTADNIRLNLRVSSLDLASDAYDYAEINVSNIPQFECTEFTVIVPPDRERVDNTYLDSIGASKLTIANPNSIPFIISTSGNGQARKKCLLSVNGYTIFDDSESSAPTTFDGESYIVDITTAEIGEFSISLRAPDGSVTFGTIPVKILRQPVVVFFESSDASTGNTKFIHVSEYYTNPAKVYRNYKNYNRDYGVDESDVLSDIAITYDLPNIERDGDYITINAGNIPGRVYGKKSQVSTLNAEVDIRAISAESGYYTQAYAIYTLRVKPTEAFVYMQGLEVDGDIQKLVLYKPGDADMPSQKPLLYEIKVNDYRNPEQVEAVDFNVLFPDMHPTASFIYPMNDIVYIDENNIASVICNEIPSEQNNTIEVEVGLTTTDYYQLSGTQYGLNSFYIQVLANTKWSLVVTPSSSWHQEVDSLGRPVYYLYYNHSAEGTGENPAYLTISLTSTENGYENTVPIDHVLKFQNGEGPIVATEQLGGIILNEDGRYRVKRETSQSQSLYSEAISTPASSHIVVVQLMGNANGSDRDGQFTIYAEADGVPLGQSFTVHFMQQGNPANKYELVTDDSYVCSDGNTFEHWKEHYLIETGLPIYAGSHELPLKINYKGQGSGPYPLGNQTITVDQQNTKYYVYDPIRTNPDDYDSHWMPAGDDDPKDWLSLEPISGEPSIATDSNGCACGILSWYDNDDVSTKRRCDLALTCTLKDSLGNPTTSVLNAVFLKSPEFAWFRQKEGKPELAVWFYYMDNGVEVRVEDGDARIIDTQYGPEGSEPAYYAVPFLVTPSGESRINSGYTVSYRAANNRVVELNEYGGIENIVGTGYVDIYANVIYEYGGDDLEASASYGLTVEQHREETNISYNIPTDLVFRDVDRHYIEAWSNSKAEVHITFVDNNGSFIPLESEYYEDSVNDRAITKQWFRLASPSDVERNHIAVAGTHGINFSCDAVEGYNSKSVSDEITIAKYVDRVTKWNADNAPIELTIGDANVGSAIYRIETFTGYPPERVEVANQELLGWQPISYTWPYNNDPFKVRVTAVRNNKPAGEKVSFVVVAYITHNDTDNYALPKWPAYASFVNGSPSPGFVWHTGEYGSDRDRFVEFTDANGNSVNKYNVAVNYTIDTYIKTSPSGAPIGNTKQYLVKVDSGTDTTFSVTSAGKVEGKILGDGCSLQVTLPAYNGWKACSATVPIIVGKQANNLVLNYASNSVNVGSEFTLTATSSNTGDYISFWADDGRIVGITRNGNKEVRILGRMEGSTRIVAYISETNKYAEAYAYCNVVVGPQPSCTLTFPNNKYSGYAVSVGESIVLSPIYTPNDSSTSVVYSVESGDIRISRDSVTNQCTIFGDDDGPFSIIATAERTGYISATRTITGTVSEQEKANVSIITHEPYTIYEYNDNTSEYPYVINLNASTYPSTTGTLSYSIPNSTHRQYATINASTGQLTAQAGSGGKAIRVLIEYSGTVAYNANSKNIDISIQPIPSVGPDPEVVSRTDVLNYHPNPNGVVTIYKRQDYNNYASAESQRIISYSSSNINIADVLRSKITVANASGVTYKVTLELQTSPVTKYYCNVVTTNNYSDSKLNRVVDWTSNNQTINVYKGDTFTLNAQRRSGSTGVVQIGSGYYQNGTYVKWYSEITSGTGSDMTIVGGSITPVSALDENVTISAYVPAETIGNIAWSSVTRVYQVRVQKIPRQITFKYGDGYYLIPTGNGQRAYKSDFNEIESITAPLGLTAAEMTPTFSSGGWSAGNNEGVARVDSDGIVYPGGVVGTAVITATLPENADCSQVVESYTVETNQYSIVMYNERGIVYNNGEGAGTTGGTNTTYVIRLAFFNGPNGGGSAYKDLYSVLQGTVLTPTPVVADYSFTLTLPLSVNTTQNDKYTTFRFLSTTGLAEAEFTVTQTPGSDTPGYEVYKVTRTNTMDESAIPLLPTTFDPYEDLASQYQIQQGTDEMMAIHEGSDEYRLSKSSDGSLWMELLRYNQVVKNSGYIISYESNADWLKVYWGDAQQGESWSDLWARADYDANNINPPSSGKLFPHVIWQTNSTGQDRVGTVEFFVLHDGQREGKFTARIFQTGY